MSYTNERTLLETLVRIATALEAQNKIQLELAKSQTEIAKTHLEYAKTDADPLTITAADVRGARRELLLRYADELGVTTWGEEFDIVATESSNNDLRRWCLAKLAEEELVPS